ncbi:hypothetical protein [Sphingomonas sp. KR3-1]|uniref:hypothetical protein n=1 Tax=Sphingomonas sp. KR3-1 TaxID=3156611 RepID=UPI0032B3218B
MILAALVLQAAAPQSAVDAERAFNAAAQAKGQWTAFRAFAASDATMFVPQPVKAQDWLKDRKDPPRSVGWWPTKSYVSCDGKLAVNTGGWKLPDGTVGYFSTVWRKEADGSWKWIVDGGDALTAARPQPAEPVTKRASCAPMEAIVSSTSAPADAKVGDGESPDGTIAWHWQVTPDGARTFEVMVWNGKQAAPVLNDKIAAPAQ